MALLHTPYDGSKQPFTVGLEPIEESCWLEIDTHLAAHLERKTELLEHSYDAVFRQEAETDQAQLEVLDLVLAHLATHHTTTHEISSETVALKDGSSTVDLNSRPALETAARLIQEDLVLMRASDQGYRLVAACLCFPSSWSLEEKHGQTMRAIHETVPGFNDGRMGAVVGRIFDNLKVGQLVGRYNWAIYDDADLHHPEARQLAPARADETSDILASLFIRVERQTLRRLPASHDILFTIKIHHDPMSLLRYHDDSTRLASSLRQQLCELDPAQLHYKGLSAHCDLITNALAEISLVAKPA